ncbi:MAG: response regulator [Dakarella massiliensis]
MQENILVVDDNDDIRSNVAEYLRAKGWKAEEASTGPMAVAQVHTGAFDLVLLDLGLPGMDGIEVCRKLRSEGYSLPIMMLTARDELDDRVAGLQSGADDYLVKPFHSVSSRPGLKRFCGAVRERW